MRQIGYFYNPTLLQLTTSTHYAGSAQTMWWNSWISPLVSFSSLTSRCLLLQWLQLIDLPHSGKMDLREIGCTIERDETSWDCQHWSKGKVICTTQEQILAGEIDSGCLELFGSLLHPRTWIFGWLLPIVAHVCALLIHKLGWVSIVTHFCALWSINLVGYQ